MADPNRFPRDIPPLWFVAALLTMLGLHAWWPGGVWLAAPWSRAGWVVVAAAATLGLGCVVRFRRAGTGVRPFTPAMVLVEAGAFRWTRNPMYTALVAGTVGVAVVLGTWTPLVVPPAFFLLLDRRFVRAEEVFMRQRFGAAYDDYCARVRRWL